MWEDQEATAAAVFGAAFIEGTKMPREIVTQRSELWVMQTVNILLSMACSAAAAVRERGEENWEILTPAGENDNGRSCVVV